MVRKLFRDFSQNIQAKMPANSFASYVCLCVLIAYRCYHYAIHHSDPWLNWNFRVAALLKQALCTFGTFHFGVIYSVMLGTKGLPIRPYILLIALMS